MKKTLFIFGVLLVFGLKALAQDPQFTQFYAAPLYLNPAFAGSSHLPRVSASYRNQWSGLPASFSTFVAGYDHWFKSYNSGVGLLLMNDRAGSARLQSTSATAIYAYELKITDNVKLRSGLEFGFVQRTLDYNQFIFGDQLLDGQGNISGGIDQTQEQFGGATGRVSYMDVGTGFMLYSRKLFLGVAGKHLNQPNQSMIDGTAPLPIKYVLHGGAKLPLGDGGARRRRGRTRSRQLEDTKNITPAFMYRSQGKYDQLDLGAYVHYNPMILGVWYRGVTGFKKEGSKLNNQDAMALLIGFQQDNFTVGYSYDVTLSQLGFKTAGSHELSASFEIPSNNRKRKGSRRDHVIPCPKF